MRKFCESCRAETMHYDGAAGRCRACVQYERHGCKTLEESLRNRLAANVAKQPGPNGCWLWTGALHDRRPYGVIGVGGKVLRAHRVAYELANGGLGVLGDLDALHTCDNPPCIRPDHLKPGTPADNSADMVARDRPRGCKRTTTRGKAGATTAHAEAMDL
jgi:hypothetical protein